MKNSFVALAVCACLLLFVTGCTDNLGPVEVKSRQGEDIKTPTSETGEVGVEPH